MNVNCVLGLLFADLLPVMKRFEMIPIVVSMMGIRYLQTGILGISIETCR